MGMGPERPVTMTKCITNLPNSAKVSIKMIIKYCLKGVTHHDN